MVKAFTNTAITAKGFKSAMSEVNIRLHREEAKLLPLRAATHFFPTETVCVVFVAVVMKPAKGSSGSLSAGVAALPRQISATSVTSCVSSHQVLLGREGKTTLHLSKVSCRLQWARRAENGSLVRRKGAEGGGRCWMLQEQGRKPQFLSALAGTYPLT